MSAQPKLASDIEGLAHQVDPLSRRGFFMAASAAAAAGYTLAAGPVRADAIKTDTSGLTAGDAKVKVADGEMPVYYARPANVQNPPVILVAMEIFGLHEYIKDVTRRLAKLGAFAIAPDYYFRKGEDLTKITEIPQADADRQSQAGRRASLRSRRHRGLGQVAGRRHQPARHHGLLPRRTHGLGIRRPQQGPQGGRRVLRPAGRPARANIGLAEEPDRACARDEGAGARPLWRSGPGHSGGAGGSDARRR